MDSTPCRISFRHEPQTVILKVEGRATFHQSCAVRKFVEKQLQQGGLCLDLGTCDYMDSTFLGTLLGLQRSGARRGAGRLLLVSVSPECVHLFQQMGVERLFPLVARQESTTGEWNPLPEDSADAGGRKVTVLKAHQELAQLPGAAGAQFRPVAALLAAEMDNSDSKADTQSDA
jgi:anti-anti-sigma factor